MATRVIVLDYGVGNLLSVSRALAVSGADVALSRDPAVIRAADRLVVPGVGAFGACVQRLRDFGLDEEVQAFARSGRPFLGICVGMQMLMESSAEFGNNRGLGLIPGGVVAIGAVGASGMPRRVPHIGWASLSPGAGGCSWGGNVLSSIDETDRFYFVHSFHAQPEKRSNILAECDYDGIPVCAAVRRDNVVGVQFHPEKSGKSGLKLLSNFLRL